MRYYLTAFLQNISPRLKYFVTIVVDFSILSISIVVAYALRLSSLALPPERYYFIMAQGPLLGVLLASIFGVYRSISRTYSAYDELKLVQSQALAGLILFIGVIAMDSTGFPRSLAIIYSLVAIVAIIITRRVAIALFSGGDNAVRVSRKHRNKVMIYGADQTGLSLLLELERQGKVRPIAFLDSDESLKKRRVHGRKVYLLESLPNLISRHNIEGVYIAKRGITYAERQRVVDYLKNNMMDVRIVPGLDEIATGDVSIRETREINVDDLLGRDSVPPNNALINRAIRDKIVLITGAGGSIGSELVRQAFKFGPKKMILLEQHEYALFVIQKKLEPLALAHEIELECVMGSICDEALVESIFVNNAIDTVYHAAAYKHVNLVQSNVIAGILNNVEGTRVVATAAKKAKVALFGLVSTDKAVRPTGAMGATKRVAEMIVQNLAVNCTDTIFTMVRFGNVLGSSGSVVPIFEEQIRAGGPVTVTHPDVIRYFMLISEASQLVIQASAMAVGGEVFVLDMGEPVKIADLARMMVQLAGRTIRDEHNPDGDIELKFTGLLPGEKLYEELLIGGNIISTEHPRIFRSQEEFAKSAILNERIASLMEAIKERNVVRCMRELMDLASPTSAEIQTQYTSDVWLAAKTGEERAGLQEAHYIKGEGVAMRQAAPR